MDSNNAFKLVAGIAVLASLAATLQTARLSEEKARTRLAKSDVHFWQKSYLRALGKMNVNQITEHMSELSNEAQFHDIIKDF